MRSLAIVIITLLVAVGLFGAFMWMDAGSVVPQTQRGPVTFPQAAPPAPSTRNAESVVGAGDDVWIQTFDKQSGDLVSEFRADRYDPPVDGEAQVSNPQARFYTRDGKLLTIDAARGQIVLPESVRKSERIDAMQGTPPSRGVLHDVTVRMYETPDATEAILTCTLAVLAFDNDTLRMNTVQTRIDGRDVLADRVPVTVRGRDYDFDGEGLIVRYNQRDQRLEYLEITHGKRLVVKNTRSFGTMPGMSFAPNATDEIDDDDAVQLVSTDANDAVTAAKQDQARRRAKREAAARRAGEAENTPFAYRAVIDGATRITEGQELIGEASRVTATFTLKQNAKQSEEQNATPEKQLSEDAQQPTTLPSTRRAKNAPPAVSKDDGAAESFEPITLAWDGKLTITPVVIEKSGLRTPADRVVEFVGNPVKLQRGGASIEAARVSAGAVGNRFVARSDANFPVITFVDPGGLTLKTTAVDFLDGTAVIAGESSATLRDSASDSAPGKTLAATWKKKATLDVSSGPGARVLKSAAFEGDVIVSNDTLRLTSDTLNLSFAGRDDAKTPTLESADARGNVLAVVRADNGQTQTLSADTLKIVTAPGPENTTLLRRLDASGRVKAKDATQTIESDELSVTLTSADAKAPQKVELDKLTAQGNVRVATQDDVGATGDLITVTRQGATRDVMLMGRPATLKNRDATLQGQLVRYDSTSGAASIVGAGTLTGALQSNANTKPQPVTLTWKDSLDYRPDANRIDITGGVQLQRAASDGTDDTATASRMIVELSQVKTTPTNATPSTPPLLAARRVNAIELRDDVEVRSLLTSPTGELLRRVHVFAPIIRVENGQDNSVASVTIPAPGRMLYQDLAAPEKAPSPTTSPATALRGAVAVEWKKSMIYSAEANRASLEGDVVVVHSNPGEDSVKMLCDRLVAELSTRDGRQQIDRVVADRGASFESKQLRFDAASAEYLPGADRIIARGAPQQPVRVFDNAGASGGAFDELWWNLRSNRPERLKNVSATIRR